MKKRLLSAALALAMVLTLLPVSVFAANLSGTANTPPTAENQWVQVQVATEAIMEGTTTIVPQGQWYWSEQVANAAGTGYDTKYYVMSTGVVNTSEGASGTWYASVKAAVEAGQYDLKLLGNEADTSVLTLGQNLTVDLNGKSWANSVTAPHTYTATVNGYTQTYTNSMSAFTLKDNSVGGGGTFSGSLTIGSGTKNEGQDVTVTLNNARMTGKIQLNHAGNGKVEVINSTVTNADGIELVAVPSDWNDSPTGGTVSISGGSTVGNKIKLDKLSGYSMTDGTVEVTSSSVNGWIAVNSVQNAKINLTNSNVTGEVSFTGYNSSLVSDSSKTGNVTIFGGATAPADGTSATRPSVIIKGVGGQTADIKQKASTGTEALIKPYNIQVLNNAKVNSIELGYADITVDGGEVTTLVNLGMGTLTLGSAQNTTRNTVVGNVQLGSDVVENGLNNLGDVKLDVAGTNITTGTIYDPANNTKTITVNIPATGANPAKDTNRFQKIEVNSGLNHWNEKTVSGGHFSTPLAITPDVPATNVAGHLLASDLLYRFLDNSLSSHKYSYWKANQINDLVAQYSIAKSANYVRTVNLAESNTSPANEGQMILKVYDTATVPSVKDDLTNTDPDDAGPENTNNDATEIFKVYYDAKDTALTSVTLPSMVNSNPVKEWTYQNSDGSAGTPITGGNGVTLPIATAATAKPKIEYYAVSLSYGVTKVTDVTVKNLNVNPTVRAEFSSNAITLSGSVTTYGTGNTSLIQLRIKTDAGTFDIDANWVPSTNQLTFTDTDPSLREQTDGSLFVSNSRTALQLSSGTVISLRNGGLKEEASNLRIHGTGTTNAVVGNTTGGFGGMRTTVSIDADIMNVLRQQELAEKLTIPAGIATSPVNFSQSPAVLENLGAVLATIDNTQVAAWLKSAREQAYTNQHPGQTAQTDADRQSTGYDRVVAELYMQVNVTNYSDRSTVAGIGMLTATMTPYVRVEVQHGDYNQSDWEANPPITVREPVSLGSLTGDVGTVTVTIPTFQINDASFNPGKYAHQNDIYVSEVNGRSFALTHGTSSGFGTIVINNTVPGVEVKDSKNASYNPKKLYNTIQAAVDDTVNGDIVSIAGTVTGNHPINMTGDARTIFVDVKGNATISNSNNGVILSEGAANHTYQVQLTRSSVAKPTTPVEEGIAIYLGVTSNGSASLSATRAKAGDIITVSVSPSIGYVFNGLTVRTNTGASVGWQTIATNQFRFTVPTGENLTSITVTPTFARSSTTANIIVDNTSSAAYGLASANMDTARSGDSVIITTRPFSGYSAIGVTAVATINGSNSTVAVARIAENTYTFVVPLNATTVTVTPSFGQSGHPFVDVPSSHWANDAVTYVYNHGLMNGAGSTSIFSGTTNISRCDLVLILYRLSGEPYSSAYSGFNDVSADAYYAEAVTWASSNGIVTGGAGNNFYPKLSITRQDLASILYRYNQYRGGSTAGTSSLSGYTDRNQVAEYALAPMQWAVGNGIVLGSYNTLNPKGNAQRYEAATMLMRYCQNFLNMQ